MDCNCDAGTEEQERSIRTAYAKKIYCHLAKDAGMNVCSWSAFPAWQEYVEGKIGESELASRAEAEVERFLSENRQEDASSEIEKSPEAAPDGRRIKKANRIYAILCRTSGLESCFFRNFSAWSEYVKGSIEEETFIESAESEIRKMKNEQALVRKAG